MEHGSHGLPWMRGRDPRFYPRPFMSRMPKFFWPPPGRRVAQKCIAESVRFGRGVIVKQASNGYQEELGLLRLARRTIGVAALREMVRLHNVGVAYAMAKTKRYFTELQLEDNDAPAATRFSDALKEYAQLDFDQSYDWEQSVLRRYPRFEQFLM
jgi:hypothetical protein